MINSIDYKVVHFTGYLRSDLDSNLKFLESSAPCGDNSAVMSQQSLLQPHLASSTYMMSPSLSTSGSSNGGSSSSSSGESPKAPSSSFAQPANFSASPYTPPNSHGSTSSMTTQPTGVLSNAHSSSSSTSLSKISSFAIYHSASLLFNNSEAALNTTPSSSSSGGLPYLSATSSSSSCNNLSQSPTASTDTATAGAAPGSDTVSSTAPPVIQYYLIAYGQVKPHSDETALPSFFVSKLDLDAKFISIEPWYRYRSLFARLCFLISRRLIKRVPSDRLSTSTARLRVHLQSCAQRRAGHAAPRVSGGRGQPEAQNPHYRVSLQARNESRRDGYVGVGAVRTPEPVFCANRICHCLQSVCTQCNHKGRFNESECENRPSYMKG